jgi:hypothetical protein
VDIEETLQGAGFIYDHERTSWFNRSARKFFSGDAVAIMTQAGLMARIAEPVSEGQFWFYFNFVPTDRKICAEILAKMNLAHLIPVVKFRFPGRRDDCGSGANNREAN